MTACWRCLRRSGSLIPWASSLAIWEVISRTSLMAASPSSEKEPSMSPATANAKIAAGERVLIYTSWTRTDSQRKLQGLLNQEGIHTDILAPTISPEKRERKNPQ